MDECQDCEAVTHVGQEGYSVVLCPLHAAAPEMRAALARLLALHPDQPIGEGDGRELAQDVRALLARIDGAA